MADAEQKKKTLLIVEDDLNLQKLLTDKLKELDIDIIAVDTGQKAINRVREHRPDLVLLDIMLPGGMNGFDVLQQMQGNDVLKHVPVIVLTNLVTEEKSAMELGAEDYIVKANISLDDVVLKVKNHLR